MLMSSLDACLAMLTLLTCMYVIACRQLSYYSSHSSCSSEESINRCVLCERIERIEPRSGQDQADHLKLGSKRKCVALHHAQLRQHLEHAHMLVYHHDVPLCRRDTSKRAVSRHEEATFRITPGGTRVTVMP